MHFDTKFFHLKFHPNLSSSLFQKLLIILPIVMIAVSSTLLLSKSSDEIDSGFDINTYIQDEEQYFSLIKKISFDGVHLNIVKIERGDNYWKIARRYNVDIDTLIGANPHWTDLLARTEGRIVVPSKKGVLRFVKSIDELDAIAREHSISRENLFVQKMSFTEKMARFFGKSNQPIAVFALNGRPRTSIMTSSLAKQFELREMFRSPLGGRFSSFFGSRMHPILHRRAFHDGIDIAARYGTPVGAPSGGLVIAAGWMGAYGKAVVMQHKNGYKTLCGHLSAIYVREGQQVSAGRIIGRVGSTGFSTGPHLHFSLWKNGRPLDPMKVLW